MNDDTISRQAAINVTWEEPTYTDPLNVLTEVRDRIKELPSAQPELRWIPCSERLPKKGTRAVLLYSNEKISGGVYMGDRTWNVDYNDTDLSVYIVAWQPTKQI